MASEGPAAGLSIHRHASNSPRQQTSNLTSALQSSAKYDALTPAINIAASSNNNSSNVMPQMRKESISMGGLTPQQSTGAVPIATGRSQPRRESLAGSMMNGMSWGGVSMNSWVRDDIIMQGSSPYTAGFQSPSLHSSSYLPKLEANFMKDFTCCGLTLPSLHDLLQHYETVHTQNGAPTSNAYGPRVSEAQNVNITSLPVTSGPAQTEKQQVTSAITQGPAIVATSALVAQPPSQPVNGEESRQSQPLQDMDSVEDMEMDDVTGPSDFSTNPTGYVMPAAEQFPRRNQFGQSRPSAPPLDMNALNNPFQGIRQSQPSTPVSGGRAYHNNPTVSSVNTPTLSAHPLQQQFRTTPDSSAPGTPGELDADVVGNFGNMSMDASTFMSNQPIDFNAKFGFGGANSEMLELCIDDPAKRLFSPGGVSSPQTPQNRLGTAQYGPNSEIARRIREQQRKVGLPDTVNGLNGEEPKPFRCPVIGCEKAYKNQNGLKYHKAHGHNNQQLHENPDGTFSIMDPVTHSPYPGTLGMEKEKPHSCDKCGKRYKNLNGLKYHKAHSPPCNPELKLNAGVPINATAMNANVAGAGLPGIGEDM